jgi:hypothetical protein
VKTTLFCVVVETTTCAATGSLVSAGASVVNRGRTWAVRPEPVGPQPPRLVRETVPRGGAVPRPQFGRGPTGRSMDVVNGDAVALAVEPVVGTAVAVGNNSAESRNGAGGGRWP